MSGYDFMKHSPDGAESGGTGDSAAGNTSATQATGLPGFSGTLVEKKDPVSGQSYKVPVELEPFIGHLISSTRNSVESQYKPIVEKLQGDTSELSEVRAELQKLQEAQMTAEEKAQANAARKIAEHEAQARNASEESKQWKTRFMDTMIKNDIYGSFGDLKLCNPEQTAILLQSEGRATVEEVLDHLGKPTGQFQTRLTLQLMNETTGNMEIVEGTPKELFKKWIGQERNMHHQLNNLIPGGNSSGGPNRGRNGVDYMKLSPEERLRVAREK